MKLIEFILEAAAMAAALFFISTITALFWAFLLLLIVPLSLTLIIGEAIRVFTEI
jgi:hypothetical protein